MRYDPHRHHRRSLRLSSYDYSQAGVYFITICVHNRECLLGEIVEGTVKLSQVGQVVERAWQELPQRFPHLTLDECVLMPNHLHAILVFTHVEISAPESTQATLGKVLRAFKSLAAIQANRLLERAEQPFWQRNYFDRIVRDEEELQQIRTYIINNPAQWAIDAENPHAKNM